MYCASIGAVQFTSGVDGVCGVQSVRSSDNGGNIERTGDDKNECLGGVLGDTLSKGTDNAGVGFEEVVTLASSSSKFLDLPSNLIYDLTESSV